MTINEHLKQLRIATGMTLEEVSDLTFISPSAISNYENDRREIPYNIVLKLAELYGYQIQLLPINATANLKSLDFSKEKDWLQQGREFFNYWWENQAHTFLPKNFLNENCNVSLENKKLFLKGIIDQLSEFEDPYIQYQPSSEMYYLDWSNETLSKYGVTAFMIDTIQLSQKLPFICSNYPELHAEFIDRESKLSPKAFDMVRGDLIHYPIYEMFKNSHVIKKSFVFNFPVNGVTPTTF